MYAVITLPAPASTAARNGGKYDVPQLGVGEVDLVVVAAAERGAVAGEVLGTGDDPLGRAELAALEAADLGRRDRRAEVRILAGALDDAAPARVAGDVDHRRERPVDADRPRLAGGDGLARARSSPDPRTRPSRSAPGGWCGARG